MTNHYQYFSPGFQCMVEIAYKDGIFLSAATEDPNIEIKESTGNINANKAYFFVYEEAFLESTKNNKTLLKVEREITFQMFYDRYEHKVGKHEAEKAWNKLTKRDRHDAYNWIPAYNSWLKLNPVARQYPASYLNAKRWIK